MRSRRWATLGGFDGLLDEADSDGAIVAAGQSGNPFSPSTLESLGAVEGSHTAEVENYRVRVTAPRDGLTSVTALSLDGVDEATGDFRRALALGGGIILALIAGVVWLLVRSLTRRSPRSRLRPRGSPVATSRRPSTRPADRVSWPS